MSIPAIKTWTTQELLSSSDLNSNFAIIRNTYNAAWPNIALKHIPQTVTGGWTFAENVAISTGKGLTLADGAVTLTKGDVVVTEGDVAVATGNVTVATGDVTITTGQFNGSGAGLTNIPAANLTGTLGALSGANLTNLNGSNIATGTVAQARLPATYTLLTTSGTVNLSASAGSPNAFVFSAPYVETGASTPVALGNAPTTGVGWAWIRAESNLGPVWMPVLRTV